MKIRLPNGIMDGPDLFNYAEIDELKGKQQNYLVDKDLVEMDIGHIPKILEDLILSLETKEGMQWKGDIGEAIWKLSSGDVETILIKIRENTFGPEFYHQATCTHCNHVNKGLRLDLDKLKLTTLTKKEIIDKKRLTFTLPKLGKEVEVKPLYLKDLFEVIKITSNKHKELITSIVAISVSKLGEKTNITKKDIEDLSANDIYFMQDKLEELKTEGYIDTMIEITCQKCKKDFEQKLNVLDPDFFVHTKATNN